MENDKTPEHLFHYTSIGNLCLILKSRSIRFTRLDKVNDPEEALTKDFGDASLFTYASCWTYEKEESLPLWNIYSSDMRGVRIRLPINMFAGRKFPEYATTGYPIIFVDQGIYIKRGEWGFPPLLFGPMEVYYDKDPINKAKCFTIENNTIKLDLMHLGLIKHEYWCFEKEYRYRLIGMPVEGQFTKDDLKQFCETPTNEYIDIKLDDSVISELIVQLGPKATISDDIIVRTLLKEFAPGAKLYDSSIKIKR